MPGQAGHDDMSEGGRVRWPGAAFRVPRGEREGVCGCIRPRGLNARRETPAESFYVLRRTDGGNCRELFITLYDYAIFGNYRQ